MEIAFPGFKFQNFSGDYAPTHVAFGHWYPPLIIMISIVSINFAANLDAQNAGNGISMLQISKIFWGSMAPHM